jgi:hypothetical protein
MDSSSQQLLARLIIEDLDLSAMVVGVPGKRGYSIPRNADNWFFPVPAKTPFLFVGKGWGKPGETWRKSPRAYVSPNGNEENLHCPLGNGFPSGNYLNSTLKWHAWAN